MRLKFSIIICAFFVFTGIVYGASVQVSITDGWDVTGTGSGVTSIGQSQSVHCSGGDPSITMGITSTSSIAGSGSVTDQKTGSQSATVTLGGFKLSAGYNGKVNSSMSLTSGSASTTAFLGASATGISTGRSEGIEGYDIFGSADLTTEGYLNGKGVCTSAAQGSAFYDVSKVGTPSEVWGQVSGTSNLRLQGLSSSSMVSTGGAENGLHTDSRVTRTIGGGLTSTSNSRITSYGSVINSGKATATSSGSTIGGAWDQTSSNSKVKNSNENVISYAQGTLTGYAEVNGQNDAADVSSAVEAASSKSNSYLSISGGPCVYASATQSSSAARTYAKTGTVNAKWGSSSRTSDGKILLVEKGTISEINSLAQVQSRNAFSTTFGRIFMATDYTISTKTSTGSIALETYAEASKDKKAYANTTIGHTGSGEVSSKDTVMTNKAGYTGSLTTKPISHSSSVDAAAQKAATRNKVNRAYVDTNPKGDVLLIQPFGLSTLSDPNFAWSRTEGSYSQSS